MDIATESPKNKVVRFEAGDGLLLASGVRLEPFEIAYATFGTLNEDKSNVILICHALTGNQFVADGNGGAESAGWWSNLIGPGKAVDTDRYFVICSNVLGGCSGSTGPGSDNPDTGKPYGLDFPVITISDMVQAQVKLIDYLGIDKLFSVVGGSMGGMQVLVWAADFPDRLHTAIPIATTSRHSSQNIAFHEVGRQAVMADPEWCEGKYIELGKNPRSGLAVARMAAHITYLSDEALHQKFGRSLQDRDHLTFGFDADFQVESYLRYQGNRFVDRFDANSYLYITRAMDYFDLPNEHNGLLANAFRGTGLRFCVISFTSDWLYPTRESRFIVKALNSVGANVSFVDITSDKGHDAFLLDEPEMASTVRGFLDASANSLGVEFPQGNSRVVDNSKHDQEGV